MDAFDFVIPQVGAGDRPIEVTLKPFEEDGVKHICVCFNNVALVRVSESGHVHVWDEEDHMWFDCDASVTPELKMLLQGTLSC